MLVGQSHPKGHLPLKVQTAYKIDGSSYRINFEFLTKLSIGQVIAIDPDTLGWDSVTGITVPADWIDHDVKVAKIDKDTKVSSTKPVKLVPNAKNAYRWSYENKVSFEAKVGVTAPVNLVDVEGNIEYKMGFATNVFWDLYGLTESTIKFDKLGDFHKLVLKQIKKEKLQKNVEGKILFMITR